jgi:hypothetical protein
VGAQSLYCRVCGELIERVDEGGGHPTDVDVAESSAAISLGGRAER